MNKQHSIQGKTETKYLDSKHPTNTKKLTLIIATNPVARIKGFSLETSILKLFKADLHVTFTRRYKNIIHINNLYNKLAIFQKITSLYPDKR
jgi:hypothetical protein